MSARRQHSRLTWKFRSKELFVQSAINTLSTTSVESDEAFNIRSSHSESLSGLVSVT